MKQQQEPQRLMTPPRREEEIRADLARMLGEQLLEQERRWNPKPPRVPEFCRKQAD